MGKFRSKLKRNNKGKQWGHGQSATSNPENKKHRNKARSRFFQPNLSLAPTDSKLTADALHRHTMRQAYANGADGTAASVAASTTGARTATINDIAGSLRSFALNDDDLELGQSELGTLQTHKTFASTYSACTNVSFNKLLLGFRDDSPLHKEMLAILAALTSTIEERGGSGSSAEYFLALMESFDSICARGNPETVAAVSLLSMGIKTVPPAILRAQFSATAVRLLAIMQQYMDDAEHLNALRALLSCVSALLRAQPHADWSSTATTNTCFDAMLAFVVHSKPKIRKSAQQAITSVIHGSCFMAAKKPLDGDEDAELELSPVTYHPAGGRVVRFCLAQFTAENIANAHTTVLHTLGLLRETMHGFRATDIQTLCERLLSIMTATNVLIRTNCFHVLHGLFAARSRNLSAELCGKLITALYEYRPEKSDARQTLAWLTVLKEAHVCLSAVDLPMTVRAVPTLVEVCAGDLWLSERNEVVGGASNAIRELFLECVRPACATLQLAAAHEESIRRCIDAVAGGLAAPFGHVATQVVLTFATVFEVCGKWFGRQMIEPLRTIGGRYDVKSAFRLPIEHTVLAAVPHMGVECVLRALPLTKRQSGTGELELSRSWVLPLLREGIAGSTLRYFDENILPLAEACYARWKVASQESGVESMVAKEYDMQWNQLWGLFPGFCRRPTDIEYFGELPALTEENVAAPRLCLAQKLGVQLEKHPDVHAPLLDGLSELLTGADEEGRVVLGQFAKNFLPRLINVYLTKSKETDKKAVRKSALQVIRLFASFATSTERKQLYRAVQKQRKASRSGSFRADALFDIMEQLVPFLSAKQQTRVLEKFVEPILLKDGKSERAKKQQRMAYVMLQAMLEGELDESRKFVEENREKIVDLVMVALSKMCQTTQAARLNCLRLLIEQSGDDLSLENPLILRTIPELIVAYNHGTNKRGNFAPNLLTKIGEICRNNGELERFVDTVVAGFGGDTKMIINTILALKAVVANFATNLTVKTHKFMLDLVLRFVTSKDRTEVVPAIAFLITYIKALPVAFVSLQLDTIVKSLSAMVPDTKRYCRIHVGFVLRKLCKRFTTEEIVKCVPGNDEVTHKKLKNIRKELARTKRQKVADKDDSDDEMDLGSGLEKKSYTIDDILADSDSDFDDMDDGKSSKPTKKTKTQASYIQEDAENIVDLADVNAIGRITSSKPLPKTGNAVIDADADKKPAKDLNRGFKTADDGRLIIAEPTRRDRRGKDESDSDSDDDFDMNSDAEDEINKGGKRSKLDDADVADSDDDSDEDEGPSRKRAHLASGAQSMASGRTGKSSQYVAGGKGIHRSTSGAASVRSGVSRMSAATGKSTATSVGGKSSFGSAYKSKKAGGDLKKGNLDPYAYIPLSRTSMNKRTRAKSTGQFKGVVSGARKGAAAGSNRRILKAHNNKRK